MRCISLMTYLCVYMLHSTCAFTVKAFTFQSNRRGDTTTKIHSHEADETIPVVSEKRREVLISSVLLGSSLAFGSVPAVNAAVGTLPEFNDANAIIQGVTVNVADKSQMDNTINFFVEGFGMEVLRKRITNGIEDTWVGFGPEQLSIPASFEAPVSSFSKYGGHASIHIRYDSQEASVFYKPGADAPGNNVEFVQLGVPSFRISKLQSNGGNILDAYGLISVVSPAGLPVRGVIGISPDPIMLIAINCKDVKESKTFYEQLGFSEQEYPFSRPSRGTTMFEPDQPKNSFYMAPSPNCMGVLLQPAKGKKGIKPNPAIGGLNIVYTPSTSADAEQQNLEVLDPSGVRISFQSANDFSKLEKNTR